MSSLQLPNSSPFLPFSLCILCGPPLHHWISQQDSIETKLPPAVGGLPASWPTSTPAKYIFSNIFTFNPFIPVCEGKRNTKRDLSHHLRTSQLCEWSFSARIWSCRHILCSVCYPVHHTSLSLKPVAIKSTCQCVFLKINEKSTQCSKMYNLHLCCLLIYSDITKTCQICASKCFYIVMANLDLAPHMAIQTYLAPETIVFQLHPHCWGEQSTFEGILCARYCCKHPVYIDSILTIYMRLFLPSPLEG